MYLYRIGPKAFLETFNGLGGSYQHGGRWNEIGSPVIYFASSPATALLEMANYLHSPRHVPPSYRMGVYELPDTVTVEALPVDSLPEDWDDFPYPASTQAMGSEWMASMSALCLLVPSCSVPIITSGEGIIVANPRHPDISRIKLVDATKKLYSKRLFSGK
jgi:RES domain-containing protein